MFNTLTRFVREDDGATMIEYAIMAASIAVVCVVAVAAIGLATNGNFELLETTWSSNMSG